MTVVVDLGNGRSVSVPECIVSSLDDGRFLVTNDSSIHMIVNFEDILEWRISIDDSSLL